MKLERLLRCTNPNVFNEFNNNQAETKARAVPCSDPLPVSTFQNLKPLFSLPNHARLTKPACTKALSILEEFWGILGHPVPANAQPISLCWTHFALFYRGTVLLQVSCTETLLCMTLHLTEQLNPYSMKQNLAAAMQQRHCSSAETGAQSPMQGQEDDSKTFTKRKTNCKIFIKKTNNKTTKFEC